MLFFSLWVAWFCCTHFGLFHLCFFLEVCLPFYHSPLLRCLASLVLSPLLCWPVSVSHSLMLSCAHPITPTWQYRQAVSKQPSMRHQRSFSAFGFGAGGGSGGGGSNTGTLTSLSHQSRRGSQINVNVTPSQTTESASDTPEIRKYKKRFGSDIMCAALWGEFFC